MTEPYPGYWKETFQEVLENLLVKVYSPMVKALGEAIAKEEESRVRSIYPDVKLHFLYPPVHQFIPLPRPDVDIDHIQKGLQTLGLPHVFPIVSLSLSDMEEKQEIFNILIDIFEIETLCSDIREFTESSTKIEIFSTKVVYSGFGQTFELHSSDFESPSKETNDTCQRTLSTLPVLTEELSLTSFLESMKIPLRIPDWDLVNLVETLDDFDYYTLTDDFSDARKDIVNPTWPGAYWTEKQKMADRVWRLRQSVFGIVSGILNFDLHSSLKNLPFDPMNKYATAAPYCYAQKVCKERFCFEDLVLMEEQRNAHMSLQKLRKIWFGRIEFIYISEYEAFLFETK